ncbi:Zn(II)2Cys6 transcription factor [Aspergillus aculeatinus CBS 121060]|uniref:Uncharacterized protein n=1 Tax=Aspergillus aculeatinus CBS 121060 TaxID=1448322 RepID=A0ACD1HMS3_9EURO|nr:hypothetical protein BO66DRAFT_449503 [Aspergillus aculeatinus CBS 121060]RAH74734.1 hypothetical protein BO66DRAFT_449503 [Aspergillus aculeatinus CBS 121060]
MATIQGSCHNCRARKVRCDRNTPRCSSCQLRGVDCQIPASPPRILWLRPRNAHGKGEVEELHARRQPLVTENQLGSNATKLVSILGGVSIAAALNELDQQAIGLQSDETTSIGPFHAFRSMDDISSAQPDAESDTTAFADLDPVTSDAIYGLPDDSVLFSEIAGQMHTPNHTYSASNPPNLAFPLNSPLARSTPQDLVDFTAPTAKLLDHYRRTIINYLAPARVKSKSPWEKVYIPSVLGAIGEILLKGDSSNARVSLLFSVLAVSAFSLHEDTLLEDEWGCYASPRLLGNMYRARATIRLKKSLRDLSAGGTKKDKYKDILMALLSMVTICIVSGDMNNAAHYLRDIEEIIHRYGTRKVARSVKVRMLHSIYLYTRMLTERLCFKNLDSDAVATGDGAEKPFDPLAHSVQISTMDYMVGPVYVPVADDWVRDLEDSDPKFRSPFEDIYSLPQSLFELIAATTRLASSLGRSTMRDFSEPVHHSTLLASIKNLENQICSWEYGTEDINSASPRPPRERSPYHLVQAVHKALIIHFHRAIRNVNAAILQPYVHDVMRHLIAYDDCRHRLNDQSADTCWPAFIAGCEALDPQLQGEFSRWLQIAAQTTGIRMYTVALEAVRQVWEARRRPGKQDAAWFQVLFNSSDLRVLVLS